MIQTLSVQHMMAHVIFMDQKVKKEIEEEMGIQDFQVDQDCRVLKVSKVTNVEIVFQDKVEKEIKVILVFQAYQAYVAKKVIVAYMVLKVSQENLAHQVLVVLL